MTGKKDNRFPQSQEQVRQRLTAELRKVFRDFTDLSDQDGLQAAVHGAIKPFMQSMKSQRDGQQLLDLGVLYPEQYEVGTFAWCETFITGDAKTGDVTVTFKVVELVNPNITLTLHNVGEEQITRLRENMPKSLASWVEDMQLMGRKTGQAHAVLLNDAQATVVVERIRALEAVFEAAVALHSYEDFEEGLVPLESGYTDTTGVNKARLALHKAIDDVNKWEGD